MLGGRGQEAKASFYQGFKVLYFTFNYLFLLITGLMHTLQILGVLGVLAVG
jgi:hypothetical protein